MESSGRRALVVFLLAFFVWMGSVLPAGAADSTYKGYPVVGLEVNGVTLRSDPPPINLDGTVFVPPRALAEAMGARVRWDQKSGTLAVMGATYIGLEVPDALAPDPGAPAEYQGYPALRLIVNGRLIKSDIPPVNLDGQVLAPARALAEALGATVTWNMRTHVAMVFAKPPEQLVRAGATPCSIVAEITCFSLDEVSGNALTTSFWTLAHVPVDHYGGASIFGDPSSREFVRQMLPKSRSFGYETDENDVPWGPIVYTYIAGENVGPYQRDWPLSAARLDELTADLKGVAVPMSERRLLLAADSRASMELLVRAALNGASDQEPGLLLFSGPERKDPEEPAATVGAGACASIYHVACYTAADLNGRTLWAAAGIDSDWLGKAAVVAPADVAFWLEHTAGTKGFYFPDDLHAGLIPGQSLQGRPAILTYVRGETPGILAKEWPAAKRVVDQILTKESAVAVLGEVDGQPRLLLAGRSDAYLQQLVGCSVAGQCPSLYRKAVSPWDAVMPELPAWAGAGVTIDLRNPTYGGTILVYVQSKAEPKILLRTSNWISFPSNVRALFNPDDGSLIAGLPQPFMYMQLDDKRRAVYEVEPRYGMFRKDDNKSSVLPAMTYLWLDTVLPALGLQPGEQVAVRLLLPDGWSANVPLTEADGWYKAAADEVANQFITAGDYAVHEFAVGDTRFRIVQPNAIPQADRDSMNRFIEHSMGWLIKTMGQPYSTQARIYAINLLAPGTFGGGQSTYRSLLTDPVDKIVLHEMIHWWNGVVLTAASPYWNEGVTEYLACRAMLESGAWTQQEYDDWFLQVGATKPAYGRVHHAANVYEGDSLAFARDLDMLIRKSSGGRWTLFDVIGFYTASGRAQAGKTLTNGQIVALIKEVTGVDTADFFAQRW